jgi:hypothetical protein
MAHALIEGADATFTGSLVDSSGNGVGSSLLTRLTLTWYDRDTGTIIAGRNQQNVRSSAGTSTNAGVSHNSSGLLTWQLTPADTVLVNSNLPVGAAETHVALFEFGWDSSGKSGNAEAVFTVTQRAKV